MIVDWLVNVLASAAVASALLGALVFLLRKLITERLSRAIAHEYDERLEGLRLQSEKTLEALREARAERESFRALALSTLTTFHTATLERRIKAVEILWCALEEIRSAVPYYIHIAEMVDHDRAKFGTQLHAALRSANLVEALKPWRAPNDRVGLARPFLSERIVALFYAAQAALGLATSTTVGSYQADEKRLWYEEKEAKDLVATVLDAEELREFQARRSERLNWLFLNIQGKILSEIEHLLSGGATAGASVVQARRILDAAAAAEPNTFQE